MDHVTGRPKISLNQKNDYDPPLFYDVSFRRHSLNTVRGFHLNIVPNFTLVNVEKPPCFLRKFSPDGKKFLAFSSDQTSLEIYSYQGPAAAADLLQGTEGEFLGGDDSEPSLRVRNSVFNRFFKLKYTVSVSSCNEQLNRECSLFTDNGRFVIVGSAAFVPEEPHVAMYNMYRLAWLSCQIKRLSRAE